LKHVKKDLHALKHNEKGYTFWIMHETCITHAKNDLHVLKHGWNMSEQLHVLKHA
jgi:hypothetical protein